MKGASKGQQFSNDYAFPEETLTWKNSLEDGIICFPSMVKYQDCEKVNYVEDYISFLGGFIDISSISNRLELFYV